ncbi:MAG: methylenetetrahydrofolate reductase [Pseudomonadota bacterium]
MRSHREIETETSGRVSVEYFPPRGLSGERGLMTGAHALRRFSPRFQSITFGAGGDGAMNSADWAFQLQQFTEIDTACHVPLARFEQAELFDFCENLVESGIVRIVLIRGDAGEGLSGFASVADAARVLKRRFSFDISVSAYPETHPKAASAQADLDALKAKQDAGCDRAITQFFFDNAVFYRFAERARAAGITFELVPGIMPIANFSKVERFAEQCGTHIPESIRKQFAALSDDRSTHSDLARSIVQDQVRELAKNEVSAIHIYGLNRVDLTADTIRAFQAASPLIEEPVPLRAIAS